MKKRNWYVYMIKCRDGTLYTGVTNDLERRIGDHDRGRGCRYTRGRGPVKLIYRESCRSSSLALRREARIKGLSRVEKMLLIGRGPGWKRRVRLSRMSGKKLQSLHHLYGQGNDDGEVKI